jgi:hypothetical protein
MANGRRRNIRGRLADLEHRAGEAWEENAPRVVVYLPRKDGDIRPVGVVSRTGGVLTVLYDREHPDPPLPEGW